MHLDSIALTKPLPCLALAVAVIQQKRSLVECAPLQSDPFFADCKATLEAML